MKIAGPSSSYVLQDIRERLLRSDKAADVRGDGKAEFLFVQEHGRACEVSLDGSAIWVQFWADSKGEDAPPAKEATVDSADEFLDVTELKVERWIHR